MGDPGKQKDRENEKSFGRGESHRGRRGGMNGKRGEGSKEDTHKRLPKKLGANSGWKKAPWSRKEGETKEHFRLLNKARTVQTISRERGRKDEKELN